jgi:hypothetical protein
MILIFETAHSAEEERILNHDGEDILQLCISVIACVARLNESSKRDRVVIEACGVFGGFLQGHEIRFFDKRQNL